MKWTYLAWVAVAVMLVAPMALAGEKPGRGGDKGKDHGAGVMGELTKIVTVGEGENKKITGIEVAARGKEKGAAPETKAIAVNESTKVMKAKEAAPGAEKPKPEEAKLTDLAVGQRVGVKCSEDGKTALEILIMPAGGRKK